MRNNVLTRSKNELPEGWIKTTLETITQITLGRSPPSSTYNKIKNGLPFYQGKVDFGNYHPTPRTWCDKPQTLAEQNDILMSVRAPVGLLNISTETCGIGRGLASIRAYNTIVMMYIFYQLQHLKNQISQLGTGTTFKAITGNQVRTIAIKISPLNEQKRIVSKIESIFAQIDACKERLEQLALTSPGSGSLTHLKHSILRQAFEGRLPQDPDDEPAEELLKRFMMNPSQKLELEKERLPQGWANFRFGDFLVLHYGKSQTKANRKSGNIPVYGSSGITGHHNKALVSVPCLVVGRKGSAGNVSYVDEPCWPLYTTYFIDKFPTHNTKFLFWLLRHMQLNDLDTSTAIPSLRRDDVYSLQIVMPPLPEQHRIVSKIESIFARIDAHITHVLFA